MPLPQKSAERKQKRIRSFWVRTAVAVLGLWALAAYVIVPQFWKRHARRHPDFSDNPRITHTSTGIPGDPLNICITGSEEDLIRSLTAAGWYPADPLTFRSSVRIVADTVFRRPDDQAPVSNLYLFGRREDLAFEKPVGNSPKERHHVRFWLTEKKDDGRQVWIGSAAFDIGVELSRTTAQVTHHISPNIDAERDLLVADLEQAGRVEKTEWIDGFHTELRGRNGGGDPWYTDGKLVVITLTLPAQLKP
ncbi:MAG: LssY C-terminal domain-containing protein [Verrucomicrobiota bacterium]